MQGAARAPGADGVLEYSANADDAALPEAVRDASPLCGTFTRRSRTQLRSASELPDELPWVGMWGTTDKGRAGGMEFQNVQGDARRCPNDAREFMR
jgi:hypothetical protein